MGKVQQYFLTLSLAFCAIPATGQRFYPDDPLWSEPVPLPVAKARATDIDAYYDFFQATFFEPDKEEIKHHNPCPSQAVNTLGEVPNSAWFTNRLGTREMSMADLIRGPGDANAPEMGKPWVVLSAKNEGVTPGLVILDSQGRKYFLKFDPKSNLEMATAADVIGAKFMYDFGYFTPENYLVTFSRSQLVLNEKSQYKDGGGNKRPMKEWDVDSILKKTPRDKDGRYRAMASLNIPGQLLGPRRYYGTRTDDPNDVVPHENRRDLRGLYVFFAWLNHTDAKAAQSMDALVQENGLRYIKHYLLDFGDIMGSDSDSPKDPWRGHVYAFEFNAALEQFVSLGLYVPRWETAHYPDIPEIGHFDWKSFEPEKWRTNYPVLPFQLRTPGDDYWAAKKLMALSDEAILAIVKTGQFSDPRAVEWATECLIERRNKIGRAVFSNVLPLDNFKVQNGELSFEDLAVKYHFATPRSYAVQWSAFDNLSGAKTPIEGAASVKVPRSNAVYLAADFHGDGVKKSVTVYLHGSEVVGLDRTW